MVLLPPFILAYFMVTDWLHTQLNSFGEPTLEVDKETSLWLEVFSTPRLHTSVQMIESATTVQKKEGSCILHIRASVAMND